MPEGLLILDLGLNFSMTAVGKKQAVYPTNGPIMPPAAPAVDMMPSENPTFFYGVFVAIMQWLKEHNRIIIR